MDAYREGVLFLNNNQIIPSDFRILLLYEMPIPILCKGFMRFINIGKII